MLSRTSGGLWSLERRCIISRATTISRSARFCGIRSACISIWSIAEAVIQGRRVHLYHGDGLIKKDIGYRVLKKILRNPFNQRLYKLLHPNIGVPLALFFSGNSRKMLSNWLTEEKLEEYRQHARRYLESSDIVIFGHTHRPEIRKFGEETYVNTGEWIRKYTYAKMENGEISLWQWFADRPVEEIKSSKDQSPLINCR